MVSVCVPGRAGRRSLRMLVCLGVLSAVSACSIDVTEFTPFAKKGEPEERVARTTKANPLDTAAVSNVEIEKAGDRIATKPVYASASRPSFSESAKLDDRISVPTPVGNPDVGNTPDSIIISKGDTLYSIARKYRVKLSELMSLNNIDSPSSLRVGQRLQIPQGKAIAQPVSISHRRIVVDTSATLRPARTAVITPVAGIQERRVTLTSGTTLYRIARNNGISVDELARANGITDPTSVRAGTVLRIPAPDGVSAPVGRVASLPQAQPQIEETAPIITGAVPAQDRDLGALARDRANRKAAAIASYTRTANQYRVTPGQTILVPF